MKLGISLLIRKLGASLPNEMTAHKLLHLDMFSRATGVKKCTFVLCIFAWEKVAQHFFKTTLQVHYVILESRLTLDFAHVNF